MKKLFFALMCLAGVTMFTACEPNNPEIPTEETGMDESVCFAKFPTNVKFEWKWRPGHNLEECHGICIKLGNEWFSKQIGTNDVTYYYFQFAKDGKTLKAYARDEEAANWDDLLKSNGFDTFARHIERCGYSALFAAGVPNGDCVKHGTATTDKETILGVDCTRYDYDFVVKGDYFVDEATKIVYKFANYLDADKEQKNATFELTKWDTSVTSFEWTKP